jgi:hypothetical protein
MAMIYASLDRMDAAKKLAVQDQAAVFLGALASEN